MFLLERMNGDIVFEPFNAIIKKLPLYQKHDDFIPVIAEGQYGLQTPCSKL